MHGPATHREIEFADNQARHRYEARLGRRVVAWSEYVPAGTRITFVHTIVARSLGGRGIGGQLVRWALDDVRTRGLRIVVECHFVASYLRRHPEYDDLVER